MLKSNVCIGRKQIFSKKFDVKNIFFAKNSSFRKKIGFFSSKYKAVVINFHFRPHLLKSNIYVGRKQKKLTSKNTFFMKVLIKKTNFFLKIKRSSNKLSYETLFVENGRELFEIFHLRYYLGYGCAKTRFFAIKREKLRAFQNDLHILIQCVESFHLSYLTFL